MSDERKPVIRPWCGGEMERRQGRDVFHGTHYYYECSICESKAPIAYGENGACAAATRIPPNRPLTREQVEAMDDMDAVWMHLEKQDHILVFSAKSILTSYMPVPIGASMFARNPTPADIETARKERDA